MFSVLLLASHVKHSCCNAQPLNNGQYAMSTNVQLMTYAYLASNTGVPPSSSLNCSLDSATYTALSFNAYDMWPFDFCR
jgi:hypothetical protein